jgi:hypothetical protein
MTEKDKFLLDFYRIIEKIDENDYIRQDFKVHMSEICKLFKRYGVCAEEKTNKKEGQ